MSGRAVTFARHKRVTFLSMHFCCCRYCCTFTNANVSLRLARVCKYFNYCRFACAHWQWHETTKQSNNRHEMDFILFFFCFAFPQLTTSILSCHPFCLACLARALGSSASTLEMVAARAATRQLPSRQISAKKKKKCAALFSVWKRRKKKNGVELQL